MFSSFSSHVKCIDYHYFWIIIRKCMLSLWMTKLARRKAFSLCTEANTNHIVLVLTFLCVYNMLPWRIRHSLEPQRMQIFFLSDKELLDLFWHRCSWSFTAGPVDPLVWNGTDAIHNLQLITQQYDSVLQRREHYMYSLQLHCIMTSLWQLWNFVLRILNIQHFNQPHV